MLLIAKKLEGYKLIARDGALGKVKDFYFDGDHWNVRYIIVDTGGWITGRQVLIPTQAIEPVMPEKEEFVVSLSRQQVKDSPGIEEDPPVSRQAEQELLVYYGWTPYWGGGVGMGAAGIGVPPVIPERAARTNPPAAIPGGETSVRSTHEVTGYGIHATDGDIGHVEDFLLDPNTWSIAYVVVDTRNWLPGGRKVLISPRWVSDVNWADRAVSVDLTRESIKASPEFDLSKPFTGEHSERLFAHYGRLGL
ncbi:MAG: PRC-barrel domain-containing protein [Opitutaceae bacterium]